MSGKPVAHYKRLDEDFGRLLDDIRQAWPDETDVGYCAEFVEHKEFGEALENLIAIGLRNGVGFSPDQVRQMEALAAAMGMETSPFVARLQEANK